jgi:hypothetical protein
MAKSGKRNILVMWGDDIGISNRSCYSHGVMGYRTPNIDRIAKEGMLFTDAYGEQSCTAGRSSFINLQGVPAGAEARLVHDPRCARETERRRRIELTAARRRIRLTAGLAAPAAPPRRRPGSALTRG